MKSAQKFNPSPLHLFRGMLLLLTLMGFLMVLQFMNQWRLSKELAALKPTPIQSEESQEEVLEAEDPLLDLFSYLERLGEEELIAAARAKNMASLDLYLAEPAVGEALVRLNLSLQEGLTKKLLDARDGEVFFRIGLTDQGTLRLTAYDATLKEWPGETSLEDFKKEFLPLIQEKTEAQRVAVDHVRAVRQRVSELLKRPEIQAALQARHVTLTEESFEEQMLGEHRYVHSVLNAEGIRIAAIGVGQSSGLLYFGDQEISLKDEDEAAQILIQEVNKLEGRTEVGKKVDDWRARLDALQSDESFQRLLKKADLKWNPTPVETETAIEYRIETADGRPLRILLINKESGELMIKEPTEAVGSLLSVALMRQVEGTFDLPDLSLFGSALPPDKNDTNILLAGKNASNVDTIMLANLDAAKKTATLISLPRDLYHEGRKINSVYADYGMAEMAARVGEITGQKIDHYAMIDMYVFKDVIDLLGGIDVTLEQDLDDPTYKVMENGVASTLHYPAGNHHLDGAQALRIARSRHSTSDYSRAERQQIIVEGIRTKSQELGIGDTAKVLRLIKTVLAKTETDFSLKEAALLYASVKDYDIRRGNVMSTGNVLQTLRVPVNYPTSLKTTVCENNADPATADPSTCKETYALYALAPRDGNWDYIKWYVRKAVE